MDSIKRLCYKCKINQVTSKTGSMCNKCSRDYANQRYAKLHPQKYHSSKRPKATYKGGYKMLHLWITKELGKWNFCQHCGITTGIFDWSNISGEYRTEFSDWQRLCRKCHAAYDNLGKKNKETMLKRYGTMNSITAAKIIKDNYEI